MVEFDDSFSVALKYAFKLLSYRDRSEKELCQRLSQKGFSERVACEVVTYLKDRSLIDDRRFAEVLKQAAIERKYLGSKGIRNYLIKRGIPADIIDEISGDDDFDAAKRFIDKKLRHMKGIDAKDVRKKLWAALYRKGFRLSTINKAMKSYNIEEDE